MYIHRYTYTCTYADTAPSAMGLRSLRRRFAHVYLSIFYVHVYLHLRTCIFIHILCIYPYSMYMYIKNHILCTCIYYTCTCIFIHIRYTCIFTSASSLSIFYLHVYLHLNCMYVHLYIYIRSVYMYVILHVLSYLTTLATWPAKRLPFPRNIDVYIHTLRMLHIYYVLHISHIFNIFTI